MNFKTAFFGLIAIAIFLVVIDFSLNNYQRFFVQEEPFVNESVQKPIEEQSKFTESLMQGFPEGVIKQDPIEANTLFSRLDISEVDIAESVQTLLLKEGGKFGVIYEFSGGEVLYFQLKSALQLILDEDDSVFDANNLGDYSLYYNDSKRPDTVFFLALIHGRVWGFEYPRENHEIFKIFTKLLVQE